MIEAGAIFRCSNMASSSRTLSVHPKYIEEVNLAWKRKSDGREQDLAKELGRALTLVIINLFLQGEPVNRANFIEICQFLGFNWREIAGLDLQKRKSSSPVAKVESGGAITMYKSHVELSDVDKALNELVETLCEMLRRLTRKAGDLLRADRTSIFLLEPARKELGTVVADDGNGGFLLIDIPADRGIAGLAANSLEVINVPFDVYDDPRSELAQDTDKKTGYRTYTILAWPLLNKRQNLVAVVQLINKLKLNYDPEDDLSQRIDTKGFTQEDEAKLAKFAPSILKILEKCQFCYQLSLRLKKNAQLTHGGAVLPNTALVEELKRQERLLRKSLNKI
jgi:hypothetical protein